METESIPRYMRIAMSIASRIADGEFQENTRISGRSTLSSEYQVSPETVRKALNLLADMDIVRTVEGSGTIVLSAEKAEKYLETVSVRGEQSDLHSRLQGLLREYTRSSRQIYDVGARLIAAGTSPLPSEKTLPNYEVRVPDDSDKIGMSIGDLRFWQCTGATIVAVRRGQSVTVSPGPYPELRAGDVLVWCVAAPFFMGGVSRGRTVRQVIMGSYIFGVLSTIVSFVVLGNYGFAAQFGGKVDALGIYAASGDIYGTVVDIIKTIPLYPVVLGLIILSMVAFYASSFDSITLVACQYSYRETTGMEASPKRMRLFWAVFLILLPMALLFSEGSMNNLQTVSIIAAFPIGLVIILIIAGFIKDAKDYLRE